MAKRAKRKRGPCIGDELRGALDVHEKCEKDKEEALELASLAMRIRLRLNGSDADAFERFLRAFRTRVETSARVSTALDLVRATQCTPDVIEWVSGVVTRAKADNDATPLDRAALGMPASE
jgi:hypothetical protein